MFEEVRGMALPGAVIGVWNEEAPEVVESADWFVRGVTGVEWLLGELVGAIR
jgi:hypothetical protein